MRLASKLGVVFAGLALAGMSAPRTAEACGGTFCDSGPRPMPSSFWRSPFVLRLPRLNDRLGRFLRIVRQQHEIQIPW